MPVINHYHYSNSSHLQTNRVCTGCLLFWCLILACFISNRLCKGREPDGFLEVQEKLIRSMIKSFPYLDSQLIQQIVKTLAAVEIVRITVTLYQWNVMIIRMYLYY